VKRSDDTKKKEAEKGAQATHLLEILTLEPIELNLFRGGN